MSRPWPRNKTMQISTTICAKRNTKGHSKIFLEKMKSYAITVKTTTTVFQENAQDTNLKSKLSKLKRKNADQKLKQKRRLIKDNPNKMN